MNARYETKARTIHGLRKEFPGEHVFIVHLAEPGRGSTEIRLDGPVSEEGFKRLYQVALEVIGAATGSTEP